MQWSIWLLAIDLNATKEISSRLVDDMHATPKDKVDKL